MNTNLFERLRDKGLISAISFKKIKLRQENALVSVHWEIKTLLYLGVLFLTSGLGILVYKNINSIGHQVILLFLTLLCISCYIYCIKNKRPFSTALVAAPTTFFDYILLLACCTFVIFIAYLQFQYKLFGNRYGMASFFPMVVLFSCAYYFDHLGILSMAIVNLAGWLGITVTPLRIIQSNDFNSSSIIFTGLALGVLLIILAWASTKKNIKAHFEFTYANFGTHIFLISCLAAMFHFDSFYLAWFVLLLSTVYFFYKKALKDKSFYFILVISLYAYTGAGYVIIRVLEHLRTDSLAPVELGLLYFIGSGIAMIFFLIRSNKSIKAS